ncbi:MAG: TRAP transporter large permease subunit [Candidatus Sumerlaeia bacterium]|nr:TRAP transporter large permease subunit [Candidatus Sumerlaeia bacterium]
MSSVGTHELLTFFIMVGVFCAGAFFLRLQIGISMMCGALAGVLVGGYLFPLDDLIRHLVEGMFSYLDPILIIATATMFMFSIERSGLLSTLAHWTIRAFRRVPIILLAAITIVIMLPGMLTGSSTAAVLTTGALMAPVLMHMGVPRDKTGAIIAMAALLGMAAPPVNIPALIIGAGVDLPYIGLDLPLLVLTLVPALLCTWALGLPHCWKCSTAGSDADLPRSVAGKYGARLFLPLVLVVVLLVGERLFPGRIALGLPLIFMIGTLTGALTGEKVQLLPVSRDAFRAALPILGILMGVGMFIQAMTLTGARGEVVIQALRLPRGWTGLYPVIGTSLPLFGAVSSFGAASVLGVPFVLSLPTSSSVIIVNTAALSVIASLGDLMPPTALAGLFAAQVVGEPKYLRVLRWCVVPGILIAIMALLAIQHAEFLARYLVFIGGS